jgi:T4 RnlA family RNA ligase
MALIEKQWKLYKDLLALCEKSKDFYFVDRKIKHKNKGKEKIYRIFNFKEAKQESFLIPGALDATGVMFHVGQHGEPLELKSLPLPKSFTGMEALDIPSAEHIVAVLEKLDGSIIHTYLQDGSLFLKSRTSLDSPQAEASMRYMNRHSHERLKNFLFHMENNGFTVSMEYTSPHNKIVVDYDETNLSILNIRHKESFESLSYQEMVQLTNEHGVQDYLVSDFLGEIEDIEQFLKDIPSMQDIEGFVVCYDNGLSIKHVTDEFTELYNTREKKKTHKPKQLIELILFKHYLSVYNMDKIQEEFRTNKPALDFFLKIDNQFSIFKKEVLNTVNDFVGKNKDLEQKEFVLKMKNDTHEIFHNMIMMTYQDKVIDIRQMLNSAYKHPDYFRISNKVLMINDKSSKIKLT